MLSIELRTDAVRMLAAVERWHKGIDGVKTAVGIAAFNAVQANFRNLQSRPNKNNYPRTNFWQHIADKTSWTTTSTGVVVTIAAYEFRQKLEGGEIRPGAGKKYLTIPACAAAYGRTAPSVQMGGNPLQFAIVGKKNGRLVKALVETPASFVRKATKGARKGKFVKVATRTDRKVMYWLVESVHQKGDRAVLPSLAEFRRVAEVAIADHLSDLNAAFPA